jgi:cell division septation protein DedD
MIHHPREVIEQGMNKFCRRTRDAKRRPISCDEEQRSLAAKLMEPEYRKAEFPCQGWNRRMTFPEFFIVNQPFLRFNTSELNLLQRVVANPGVSSPPMSQLLPRYLEGKMRVSAQVLLCCLAGGFFLFHGCSREEELPPPPKVTQKVMKPGLSRVSEKAKPAPEAEEKTPPPGEKAEGKIVVASITPTAPEPEKEQQAPEGVHDGYYVVKRGDTLASIAARKDVYQDYLKWPILLRLNLDQLSRLPVDADFHEKELPAGMKIKVVTPRNVKTGGKQEGDKIWVVNVLSSRTIERIVPPAVTLIRKGYPVYIARADIKGKEWMRLRAGFFTKKAEADKLGKKIKDLMDFEDSWTSRVDQKEYEEFAGF